MQLSAFILDEVGRAEKIFHPIAPSWLWHFLWILIPPAALGRHAVGAPCKNKGHGSLSMIRKIHCRKLQIGSS